MATEIKRKTWSQFCRKFNVTNQYRLADVQVKSKGQRSMDLDRGAPFLGIALARKGRVIAGIDLFTGKYDPDKLNEPVVSIREPEKIILEKDGSGTDNHLLLEAKDGTRVSVSLSGAKDPERHRSLVEKLAYTIYERRGQQIGHEFDDWVEAEKRVKEKELQLTT